MYVWPLDFARLRFLPWTIHHGAQCLTVLKHEVEVHYHAFCVLPNDESAYRAAHEAVEDVRPKIPFVKSEDYVPPIRKSHVDLRLVEVTV